MENSSCVSAPTLACVTPPSQHSRDAGLDAGRGKQNAAGPPRPLPDRHTWLVSIARPGAAQRFLGAGQNQLAHATLPLGLISGCSTRLGNNNNTRK